MSYPNSSRKRPYRLSTPVRLGVAAVAACFIAAPLLAAPPVPATNLPTGFTNLVGIDPKNIVAGANSLNIATSANQSAADVAYFNIAAGYKVNIAQPTVSANVLFSVLEKSPSVIYGTLTSNGGVYLYNSNGIFVGPGGLVDVARFVATTLAIRSEDFLAGRNLFVNDGTAQDVINQGEIRTPAGGSVYLIGSNVSNSGIITTPQGETILAAGATVSLIDSATPGVKVDITGAEGNATNLGTIMADAGRIGIVGVVVRNSGTLNASSVVDEGGRIFLKASQDAYVDGDGRIVTTGTKGGQVEVLGNRVAVMDNASIDVSGASGGGRIMIGGDYQGKNPDIQNASITYFGPNASLKADATEVGDGGTVIVWADDTTRAYGSISARGGANGGNGGFVEVSGKNYLEYRAFTDTRAPYGTIGTLLLDPVNITILDSGAPSNLGVPYWGSSIDNVSSSIGWDSIAAQLGASAVTITTSPYGGNITFQQTTPWTTTYGGDLSFVASGMIDGNWGGSSTTQPSTGLKLQTAGNISFYGGGKISLGNGSVVTTGSGKSIWVASSGGSVGIGYLQALGNVTVNAKYSIWDDNWQTSGATNIYSNGAVSLTSAYGGTDPDSTCTSTTGWCSAIQADIAGSPSSISATVQNTATSGGIGIRYQGNLPSTVSLTDNSSTPSRNEVSLRATGDINFGGGHTLYSNGGGIHVEAGGNIVLGGASFSAGASKLTFFAGGNLTVNQNLTTSPAGSFLGLAAGSTLSVNNSLASAGDIGMIAGVSKDRLETIDDNQSISSPLVNQFGALLTNSGTININANVTAAKFVGAAANTVNISGATVTGTSGAAVVGAFQDLTLSNATVQGPDAFLFAGGDIRVNDGSLVKSTSDSVYLGLLGADSTLYLNDATGMSASKIHAYSPSTINVGFLSRSSGGVVIDGVETTTTVAGGSGFYVGASPVPATLGAGLQIAYAVTNDAATALLADSIATSTEQASTSGTPTDSTVPPLPPPSDTTTTTSISDPSFVVGDTEGTFGGDSTTTSTSTDSGTGTTSTTELASTDQNKEEEKKDEKDQKKSDQAKDGKKDDKSAKKKVAQCT